MDIADADQLNTKGLVEFKGTDWVDSMDEGQQDTKGLLKFEVEVMGPVPNPLIGKEVVEPRFDHAEENLKFGGKNF